jgi:uncharacterized protein
MHFTTAGIDVFPLVPPLVAFGISFFTSMGGVSGAFLLMPFQMSVLGFTSPAVTPTNMVFNIVGTPGGVYRYIREGRMAWIIAALTTAGTLPGIFLGGVVRVRYLPDPAAFKFFVGCVLLYIGGRLCVDIGRRVAKKEVPKNGTGGETRDSSFRTVSVGFRSVAFTFRRENYSFNPLRLFAFSSVVGIVGGIYGIGGGAIIAPFLVSIFRLPVYIVAGAALLSTFCASIAGVVFFTLIAPVFDQTGLALSPDWTLGVLFGVGGLAGTYCGARAQKFMPQKAVKIILAASITFVALRYISGYLL